MKYYSYLLRCSDGTLYSGATINIEQRVERHNSGKGAKYTKGRRPVKVVYFESYNTLLEARRREAQIKRWSRVKKENLVKYGNPRGLE